MFLGGWGCVISGIQVVSSLLAVATIGFENSAFVVDEDVGMQDILIIKDIMSEQTLLVHVDHDLSTAGPDPATPG